MRRAVFGGTDPRWDSSHGVWHSFTWPQLTHPNEGTVGERDTHRERGGRRLSQDARKAGGSTENPLEREPHGGPRQPFCSFIRARQYHSVSKQINKHRGTSAHPYDGRGRRPAAGLGISRRRCCVGHLAVRVQKLQRWVRPRLVMK